MHVLLNADRPSQAQKIKLCFVWASSANKELFHEATSHGIPEPTASRVLWYVEDDLIQSSLF